VSNALAFAAIVIVKRSGGGDAEVGVMLGIAGVGGILGAVLAYRVAARLDPRTIILGYLWSWTALASAFLLSTSAVVIGVLLGAMLLSAPVANSVIAGSRIAATPDALISRVQSIVSLLTAAATPVASLGTGLLLEQMGRKPSLMVIGVWTGLVALTATFSPSLKNFLVPQAANHSVHP
jgi:predicted MFS family arabinose efflux permease